jgi:hypothetical protein
MARLFRSPGHAAGGALVAWRLCLEAPTAPLLRISELLTDLPTEGAALAACATIDRAGQRVGRGGGSASGSMRKLSPRHRRLLIRHARFPPGRRRRRRSSGLRPEGLLAKGERYIPAPAVLSLAENYDEVRQFFDSVLAAFARSDVRAVIDFIPIRRITPGAALMLAAILDMWQRLKGERLVARAANRWRPSVRQALFELGLFDLLKTPNAPGDRPSGPLAGMRILRFRSGEESDGSLATALTRAMVEVAGPIEAERFLYVGLTEAMTNVAQHAYPKDAFDGVPSNFRRWWMTGSYEPETRHLTVILLDLGVGIPATLPRSSNWERIRGLLSAFTGSDDADMIEAAVEVGRSSTGASGRGLGLDEIRQFVEKSSDGRLRIVSGHGEVVLEKGASRAIKRTLSAPTMGTLIEWEVFR